MACQERFRGLHPDVLTSVYTFFNPHAPVSISRRWRFFVSRLLDDATRLRLERGRSVGPRSLPIRSDRRVLVDQATLFLSLRLSELASIQVDDIDTHNRAILVWGKGARQRLVAYGEASAKILQDYMKVGDRGEKLFNLLPGGIAQVLGRLEEKTGIKCNAHSFRRTFATESVRNGMNLFHVQSLLGHSSLTMTRIYAEQVNSEDAIKAYTAVVR